jgi:acetoin utilization deacetylase AcuC-like enzyme
MESPLADRAAIERTHAAEYVEAFLTGTLDAAAIRRIGFPWSEHSVRRTLASVGGTLAAARVALTEGMSGQLAGGTHHAFHAEGSGFCIFNDICVAIRQLRHEGRIARAAVIDLDVHQGDGTALLMRDDPLTLTFSAHGRNNFPFRKQQSKIDLEFEDDTGDEEYLRRVADVLPRVMAFNPDIVFYQSGVDPLKEDTLGKLSLTHDGLLRRDRLVLEACRSKPLVITLGGGYASPIEATVEAHANTFLAALGVYPNR